MTVVTLTGDLGSMGRIARLVAERLEYDLLEPELTITASQALAFPDSRMQALERRTHGLGPRFVTALRDYLAHSKTVPDASMFVGGAVEDVMSRTYADHAGSRMTVDDRRYFDELKEVVGFFAKRGNIVMVGRGTQLMLADARDTVHVRVVCPLAERIKRVAKEEHETVVRAVTQRIEDSDRERAAWHKKFFGADYQSLDHYQLVVNSGRVRDEDAADVIVDAVRRLGRHPRSTARTVDGNTPGARPTVTQSV